MQVGRKSRKRVKVTPPRLSRTRRPHDMSVEQWQRALRRDFGRSQQFKYKNTGEAPILSEYLVINPASDTSYRVVIRGAEPGDNYCACPDFQVNTLGTCKHIEWLLAKLSRKSGGKKALREGLRPPYSEVYLQYGARREVRFRAGASCPEELRTCARSYFDEEGALRPERLMVFDEFVRESARFDHELRIYPDALAFVAQLRDDTERRRRIEEAFPEQGRAAALNRLLKVKLYPYQQAGAFFAASAGRCLLADDMGLGKTVQAIAAVEILARTMGVQRVLVVTPTALKHQWKQEIERFTDRSVSVVEGFRAERSRGYRLDSFFKITNYDVVHQDLGWINAWAPDVVILDEAQRIKNWQTRRAKSVKQIRSEYAIVLTGTPLENRLEELHSIMEFVDRFRLGPLFRFLHVHQHTDECGKVIGYRDLDQIGKTLAPVLVRRRKSEVLLELPERTDKHFLVDMTEEQWRHHDENQKTVAEIVAKWRRMGFLTEKDQRSLMIALQNMRMACNSSYLLDRETDHSVKPDECALLLGDLLETPENKAVIFSQWLGTHELLIRRFDAAKWDHVFYHGSLDGRGRKQVIERFKKDPNCRILLSTDSGGVGLNLQEASVVINMDQPWNPAVLEQRIGRVHRLGQHRPVQVYHFVSQGTIEHGMLNVIKFKSAMFAGVLDGGEKEVFLGGTKLKRFMQTVEEVSARVPDRMPVHEQAPAAEEAAAPEVAAPAASPWQGLITAGIELLGQLGQALQQGQAGEDARHDKRPLLTVNETTGARELRVPMPDTQTGERIAALLTGLADLLRSSGVK